MQSQNISFSADLKLYSHKFVREFIETYRSLPELWKIRSKGYFDRGAKAKAYQILINTFKQVDPYANRDTVKRKINSIRTTFRKEWRKVQISKCQGASEDSVYKPSLWYYDHLLFLCDQHKNFDDSPSSSPGHEIIETNDTVYKQELIDLDDEEFFDDNSQEFAHNPSNCDTQESISEWPTTRQPTPPSSAPLPAQQLDAIKAIEPKEESIKLSTGLTARAEDEFDYIAKTWAIKLRRMSAVQKLMAEKLVNDVLFEGELGTLSRASVLIVQPKCD